MEEVTTETPEQGKVQEPQLPSGYLKVTGFANRALKRMQLLRKRFRVEYAQCVYCGLPFLSGTVYGRCQCKVQKHG